MKKTFKLWIALALMIVMGSTQVWAFDGSFTIQFKNSGQWNDGSTAVSTIEDVIATGAENVSEIPAAQVLRIFNAGTDVVDYGTGANGYGIRLGAAAGGGMVKLVLAETVKPTKITFKAKQYAEDENTITVNTKKFTLNDGWQKALYEDEDNPEQITGYADYEIEYDGKTEVSDITISSEKRAYISEIKVEYTYEVEKLYITGDFNDWNIENMIEMKYNETTKAFEYEFENIGNYSNYINFAFSDKASFEEGDWSAFNLHRWAIQNYSGVSVNNEGSYQLKISNDGSMYVYNQGTYKLSVAKEDMKLTVAYEAAEAVAYEDIDISGSYISAYDNDIAKAVEAKAAQLAAQNKKVNNVSIYDLDKTKEYTISATIKVGGNFTLWGNGATIKVAEDMTDNIVTLEGTRSKARKADGTYSDHYLINNVQFDNITILGIKGALVKDNQKTLLQNLQISSSVIEMPASAKNVIDFNGKGYVGQVYIQNSTIYAKDKNTGFFAQYGSRPKNVNGDWNQEFVVFNSTFVNIANGKNFCDLKQNGTAQNKYTLWNSIFVDCGKSGQTVVGFNKGQTSATPEWSVISNAFNWGGKNTGKAEVEKAGKQKDDDGNENDIVQNCIGGSDEDDADNVVVFADAANGDFTLGECAAKNSRIGDKRWIGQKVDDNTQYPISAGSVVSTVDNYSDCYWNTPLVEYNYNNNATRSYRWYAPKGAKVNVNVGSNNSYYAINAVTAAPVDGNWSDAKAPKRAPGFMQEISATKVDGNDTEWTFEMPDYPVQLNVSLGWRIQNRWITVPAEVEVPVDFEGKVTPEVVVEDRNNPLMDDDGNTLFDEEGNVLYKVLKEGEDYTVEFEDNDDMGTATVIVTGKGDYAGTAYRYFDIVKVLVAETEEAGKDGLVNARIIQDDEDAKLCEITKITVKEGETTLTIPAEIEGYEVVRIASNAADIEKFDKITDLYLPAIGDNGFWIEKTALLPIGFTHPQKMFNVHVPLADLGDYAAMDGLKKFAQYKRLMAEIEIGESNFATFGSRTPALFEEAVEVNIIKSYTATTVTKEVVEGNLVPANTGVLLFAKPGTYTVYAVDENYPIGTISGNKLEAVTFAQNYPLDDDDAAANAYFILKEGAFYPIADNKKEVPACRAILKVAKGDAAAAASRLDIVIDGFTGITAVKADLNNAQIYDMQGRKVNNAQKGVYIVNGKKVVIK
jgi:hypothetical protein